MSVMLSRGYEGFGGRVGRTYADSEPWWPPEVRAPRGAPNIIVMVLDDMGFSDIGPYGAEVATPTLDRLAERGLRLTNYHTAPMCSPARAALLTGVNPHRAGFAWVANADPGFPGYTLELTDDVLTLPEVLRGAGYATYAIGKWHLSREALMNDGAPRDSWPLQRGFDRFYGTLEGANSFFHPNRLISDNSPVEMDAYPKGYYLTDDLTDHAINMIKGLRASSADRPFFLYFAHHAMHGPLGAKPADIARYRGRYDGGWDRLREERFARQLAAGLFPEGTRMAPRNSEPGLEVPPWDELPAERRGLFARYMEVYAAMVDNVDQNLARLLACVEALGELDNTIVLFTSDNGGTSEGGPAGTRSYFSQFVRIAGLPPDWERDVERDPDLIGGPRSMVHYPRGWGMASNTPFRLYKTHTFAGGVRVPFLLSWPAGLRDVGIRSQYVYVTDVFPTLLELAGVARSDRRNGREVKSVDGIGVVPVLRNAAATSPHREQYAEMGGNRGFYRDGWKILTLHRPGTPYEDREWRLYHVDTDPTELHDVAADHPEKLSEMAAAWEKAAWANTVFPLNDGSGSMYTVRRPREAELARPIRLLPGTPTLERYRSSRLIALRSFEVDIELSHAAGDQGVLVAHGDQGGGYSVYVEDGHLWLAYNEYGRLHEVDSGPLAPGVRTVRLIAEARPRFRWNLSLTVDDARVGGLDEVAMLVGFAPFTGIDVGIDRRGPVSWPLHERHGPFPYRGELTAVTYRPGERAPYAPQVVHAAAHAAARAFE